VATTAQADRQAAIIGRPLTPFSVAGVARRTTRRAVAAGYYGHGYRSYGYGYGGYGYPNSYYGYTNPSNYGYANYGTSYPSNYGYASYGSSYPSNYGYATYGSSYPSNYGYASYGSSYPSNYGYTKILTVDPALWCFPPLCDRSRFTDKAEDLPVYNPQRRYIQTNRQGYLE
jgi:hypothetical protein